MKNLFERLSKENQDKIENYEYKTIAKNLKNSLLIKTFISDLTLGEINNLNGMGVLNNFNYYTVVNIFE